MPFAINPLDVQGITGPSAPISRSVVQALLAKHGAAAPGAKPSAVFHAPPTMGPMNLDAPAPVDNLLAPPVPSAPPPGALDKVGDGGAAMNAVAAQAPTGLQKGLMGRIGDFLHSDEGRAALLRSGAATLQGGLGAGIEAGANFTDRRRHEREAAASDAADRAVRSEQIQNAYNLGLGRLDIDATVAGETARHNRFSEGNEQYRVDADVYKHRTPSGDKQMEVGERRFEHINPSGSTVVTQQGENYRHDTVSGDVQAQQSGETARNTADNQTQLMRDRIAHAPTISTHAHYTTTPGEYAKNGPRLRPSEVQPQPAATGAAEVRYDGNGLAYTKGSDGSAVRAPQFDRR
jgi:hypothetical protein